MRYLLKAFCESNDSRVKAPPACLEHPALHVREAPEIRLSEIVELGLESLETRFELPGRGAERRSALLQGPGSGRVGIAQ